MEHARKQSQQRSQQTAAPTQTRSGGAGDKAQPGTFSLLGQSFTTLQAVHDWVEAESQTPGSTVPHEPVLRVSLTPGSLVHQPFQTTWSHYNPGQKLIIEGNGATVSGFRGSQPSPGFFLSYRLTVGAGTSAAAPAAANFEMRGLTVRGFEAGGVEISPQTAAGEVHVGTVGFPPPNAPHRRDGP